MSLVTRQLMMNNLQKLLLVLYTPPSLQILSLSVQTDRKIESEKERLKDAPITVHHLQSSVFLSFSLTRCQCVHSRT